MCFCTSRGPILRPSVTIEPQECAVAGPQAAERSTNRGVTHDHPDTLAIRTAAKDFFLGLPLDVIEGQGDYGGPYEFTFDFAIALDAKNGLIFSFVWNLAD